MFNRIFKKRKEEDPFYIKLKKSLSKHNFTTAIKKAYFIFGLPNTVSNAEALKRSLFCSSDLKYLMATAQYDVKVDNLELYLVEDVGDRHYFIILLDPYEVFETEKVLEIIAVNDPPLNLDA